MVLLFISSCLTALALKYEEHSDRGLIISSAIVTLLIAAVIFLSDQTHVGSDTTIRRVYKTQEITFRQKAPNGWQEEGGHFVQEQGDGDVGEDVPVRILSDDQEYDFGNSWSEAEKEKPIVDQAEEWPPGADDGVEQNEQDEYGQDAIAMDQAGQMVPNEVKMPPAQAYETYGGGCAVSSECVLGPLVPCLRSHAFCIMGLLLVVFWAYHVCCSSSSQTLAQRVGERWPNVLSRETLAGFLMGLLTYAAFASRPSA